MMTPLISIVAERRGFRVRRNRRRERPVRFWMVRESARAAKTMVRWASIASRVRAKIGYADLAVMPTSGLRVQPGGSGGAERSA